MITATTAADLRRHVAAWRAAGEAIAFVPTMGALHDGHLALVRAARERIGPAGDEEGGGRVVVSVFVNPTQFDRADDLERYPRDTARDSRLLAGEGIDLLFLPPVDEIYPPGDATRVEVAGPAEGLEGERRPGHFRGVATVVTRLFNLVQPDLAVFGEKDAQQLAVIRAMVRDLHQPVEIVGHPTVREADGLAMSSRNALLPAGDRRRAVLLHRALVAARTAIESGEGEAKALRRVMERVLLGQGLPGNEGGAGGAGGEGGGAPGPFAAEHGAVDRLEYAEVVDGASFQPVDRLPETGRVVLPIAAWVGGVRLIDNLTLVLPLGSGPTDEPSRRQASAGDGGAVQ